MAEQPAEDTRCGFVALIGAPNAGKSTLLNTLVGSKVTIVSHKVQTTRTLVRGIALEGNTQLIFVDTPGIFAPKRRLDRAMVTSAWGGAHDADVIAVLIDSRRGLDEEADAILAGLAEVRQPKTLLLNKIDLVEREKLLALAQTANDRVAFAGTFMISALTGDGVGDAKHWLAEKMPAGPWLYPADQMSDAPLRQLAAEITREKLFHRLHQELPYQSTVETESWKELRDGSIRIEQIIYVERESSAQDRARQGRRDDQGHRRRGAQGNYGNRREACAPVPVCESARGLGRRPRALPGHGTGISEGVNCSHAVGR